MNIKFNRKKTFVALMVFCFAFFMSSLFARDFNGIIGEDVAGYDGIILTVNECVKNAISTGLRSQGKMEEVKINLTLVNTGQHSYSVNPLANISLKINKGYNPVVTQDEAARLQPFELFPGMQTRLDLVFLVEQDESSLPKLQFELKDSFFNVVCDSRIERAFDSQAQLGFDEALLSAKTLIEIHRYAEARQILSKLMGHDESNPFVLMMLSTIEDAQYEPEMAAYYLRKIDLAQLRTGAELNEFAQMAMRLDNAHLVIAALEDRFNEGSLDVEQKLLLARAYYVEEYLTEAEYVLMPLISSGVADKLAHFTMGNIFNRRNDVNRAIHQWEMALDVDPQYVEAYYNIGVAYYKKQDLERAREYWRRVLINNPDSETLMAAEDALRATQY
jgi:tetratricopeptide (TPR) repeat protein